MVFGFVLDGGAKDSRKVLVGATLAQSGFNVHLLIREKAVAQLAVGGQPDAIAGWAKVVADWAYDADYAERIRPPEVPGRTVGVLAVYLLKRRNGFKPGTYLIGTDIVLEDRDIIVAH